VSDGVFRDTTAALERIARLEGENEDLREELARVGGRDLEKEIDDLRRHARGENEEAFLRRLRDERDDLARSNGEMKARLDVLEAAQLARNGRASPPPLVPLRVFGKTHQIPAVAILLAFVLVFFVGIGIGEVDNPKVHRTPRARETAGAQLSIGPISSPDKTKKASP
jgi:hypothetical protein